MLLSLRATLLFAPLLYSFAASSQIVVPAAVPPPAVAAKAYLLVDVLSGQTLAAVNADEPREPASLTKLMTAYLVFRARGTMRPSRWRKPPPAPSRHL